MWGNRVGVGVESPNERFADGGGRRAEITDWIELVRRKRATLQKQSDLLVEAQLLSIFPGFEAQSCLAVA
jgi:hypothetical protein